MRWLKRILAVLLVLIVAVGVFGFWTVRRSFPTVQGELEVAGLNDVVEVIRDDWGASHIYASNPHDLFFAQGYTHAQERFWQMDFWRHIGSGRLAEMFGSSQVDTDKFLRSLGLVAQAEHELDIMPAETREILEWYADGVNAYLAEHDGAQVSLEYAVLSLQNSSYEIEPWSPTNTLTWAKMMSWDLSGNMRSEIARAVLGIELPIDRVGQLFPTFPEEHPVIVPDDQTTAAVTPTAGIPSEAIPALVSAGKAAENLWAVTGGGFEGIGSNNWVVGGSLTESGLPLLANDTHLSPQMPSIWFENGLHCVGNDPDCVYQVVGYMFPGAPGVIIGHNENIAWGVTTEAADTQDLYIEKVNPANPNQYEVDGTSVDFETRTETIRVAGGDDIQYEVRTTRHGPVISGTFLEDDEFDRSTTVEVPEEYVVALAWQSLQPATIFEAVIGLDKAANYDEFKAALNLWDIAAQNVVYADIEGNIAYQSTGEIPIRAKGDGLVPVPGWTSEYDWIGIVPYEEMPFLFNPPQDYIATANQPILPAGSEPLIGLDGAHGYRADRIETLIENGGTHTVESTQDLQFDSRDGSAANLVPFLLEVPDANHSDVAEMQSLLSAWQGESEEYQASGDSTVAAVYQATWRHVLLNTFTDELPEDQWPVGGSRWFEVVKNLLESPDDPWWDDTTTPEVVEERDDILFKSMVDAHDELADLLGDNPTDWTWGELHIAHFENQTLGQSGIAPIEWLFNRTAPARVGGGPSIVNASGWDADKSFLVDWVPSQRMVVDLSDLSNSTFIHTTGNSGHAFHRYYDNMIEAWTDGVHAPMYWTPEQVALNASSTLTLVPGN
ncbi:MAG: penicillin acylase family protein [Actinomycetota bacterium]|nr:penicillin acylase family protein [Actinomycetota bacterium]